MCKKLTYSIIFACLALSASAQKNADKEKIIASIQNKEADYAKVAHQIWEYAEPGYLEVKSSALLQTELKNAGFKVKAGVADIPTAFVASYGSGEPVIGILAEYDALPGLSNVNEPEQKAITTGGAGHGCGHNLFGTASVAAAIAVKDWLKNSGTKGTIRLFGCPAEEGGSGKVYMVRAGLFNDVKAVLHWHPGNENSAAIAPWLANKNAKFRFYGVASHASAAPEKGRSALDAVEAMDNMVNMMREHIPSDTRIHYVITHGGEAPNVVPAFAEVYYYVRNPQMQTVKDIWERVVKAAEGAALGTGTRMDYEVIGGVYNMMPNITLSKVMDSNLRLVKGFTYSPEEKLFAEKIQSTFIGGPPKITLNEATATVQPFKVSTDAGSGASSDVADVSWTTPTAGIITATFVPGSGGHSWQNVAAAGGSISTKGMIVAAKTIALSAYDLFKNPALIQQANKELADKRGTDFKYDAMLGNRKPALDYRK